jgi:dTDP-4-amino-4,6-dideoxygalactose transaminase
MTTAEGGMVVTDREDVRDRVARFSNHGRTDDGSFAHVGHNFRMTSLAAALGSAQLDRLPDFIDARREHAQALTDVLADTPIMAPAVAADVEHAWHQYTVQSADRDALADALGEVGIDTGVYYPRAIHQEAPYRNGDHDAPIAVGLSERVLSLPVHPSLSRDDRQVLHAAIEEYAATVS